MSIPLILSCIEWDEFGGLEVASADWLEEEPYWEEYTAAFLRSNGMDVAQVGSNVNAWLTAPDRAPFIKIVQALLPRVQAKQALENTLLVLLAHWLPDLHLGTSVTNFAMHSIGLTNSFGLAISDRGLSAPLFAIDCIDKYLREPESKALLMTMDQRHLLYRSALRDQLDPKNAGCIMVFERSDRPGLRYLGYGRTPVKSVSELTGACQFLMELLGLRPETTTIISSAPDVLAAARDAFLTIAADPRRVCAAPFAALESQWPGQTDCLIVVYDGSSVYGVGFRPVGSERCA